MNSYTNIDLSGFLETLKKREITIGVENGQLILDLPENINLDEAEKKIIKDNKKALIYTLEKRHKIENTIQDIFDLTPLQEGMLFHALYAPESDQYCIQMSWEYEGNLDKRALKRTWEILIKAHDVFRVKFVWEGLEKPVQVVQESVDTPWLEADWKDYSEKMQKEKLKEYLKVDRMKGFDLTKPCLVRLHLIRLKEKKYIFIWTCHHILMDGWCLPILFRKIDEDYQSIAVKKKEIESQKNPSYKNYVEWINKQNREDGREFWKKQLDGVDTPTNLEINKKLLGIHNAINDLKEETYYCSEELTNLSIIFAKKNKITLSTLVELAWGVVLSRYSNLDDVILGTIVSGRPAELPHVESMIGLFINAIPIRLTVSKNKSVKEHLLNLHQKVQLANQYSYLSLSEIQAQTRIPNEIPLFYSLFVFENYPMDNEEKVWEGVEVRIKNFQVYEKTNYPLVITVALMDKLMFKIDYDGEYFEKNDISRLIEHIKNVLMWLIMHPEELLIHAELLSEKEKRKILIEWNMNYQPCSLDRCIYEVFEDQVQKNPKHVAIVCQEEEITYNELNEKANQLAHYIRDKYIDLYRKETGGALIGICMERSIGMFVGVLGIWKAGCAYVPLDPDYPEERLQYILKDTNVEIILTQQSILHKLRFLHKYVEEKKIVYLDKDEDEINKMLKHNPILINKYFDLAYVIYTSGSTGNPKGVMIRHNNLLSNYVAWEKSFKLKDAGHIHLQMASMSFDVFVGDLIRSLCFGGKLVIANKETLLDMSGLFACFVEHKITYADFVPVILLNFFAYIYENGLRVDSLKLLICGSDAWYLKDYWKIKRYFGSDVKLINAYGLTEATIDSTYYEGSVETFFDENLENSYVPIGKPFSNTKIFILDKHLNPVPIGITGELYIGGSGLACGYLNLDALTKEKFIINPFLRKDDANKNNEDSMLYKTGDLARWLSDGDVEFIGRIDNQIKVQGFRIELGEIESLLKKHEQIKHCVVAMKKYEDNITSKKLVAYCVLYNKKDYIGVENLLTKKLRDYLKGFLPEYMIPEIFIPLVEMPTTPSGKIDCKRLPELNGLSRYGNENSYHSPRNYVEEKLIEIWQKILNLKKIGIYDNFFELGGNSIASLQLVSLARKDKLSLSIKDVFKYPTVAEQAVCLNNFLTQRKDNLVTLKKDGTKLPLILIHDITGITSWFYRNLLPYINDRPLFVIDSQFLGLQNDYFLSLEKMASHYLELISSLNLESFHIGGWSFGGVVAFEIAKQLSSQNEKVKSVLLIDSCNPEYFFKNQSVDEQSAEEVRFTNMMKNKLLNLGINDRTTLNSLFVEVKNNNRILLNYRPNYFNGKVYLFRAGDSENKRKIQGSKELNKVVFDVASNGWKHIPNLDITVYNIQGKHEELFDPPNIKNLAEKINLVLN